MQAHKEQSGSATIDDVRARFPNIAKRNLLVTELQSNLSRLSGLVQSDQISTPRLFLVSEVLSRDQGEESSWQSLESRLQVSFYEMDRRFAQPVRDFLSTHPIGTTLVSLTGAVAPNTVTVGVAWTAAANWVMDDAIEAIEGTRRAFTKIIRDKIKEMEESIGSYTERVENEKQAIEIVVECMSESGYTLDDVEAGRDKEHAGELMEMWLSLDTLEHYDEVAKTKQLPTLRKVSQLLAEALEALKSTAKTGKGGADASTDAATSAMDDTCS